MAIRKKFVLEHNVLDKTFWTADLHFGHRAILKYCERPYDSADEMDADIVRRWNARVPKDGVTFVLGDVSFRHPSDTIELLQQLQGQKILIAGNHDYHMPKSVQEMFTWIGMYAEVDVRFASGLITRMTMCHYALASWNLMHHGAWNLHGHSHGTLKDSTGLQLDVGMDCHNMQPIDIHEIRNKILTKRFQPVDHHRPKE